jgi:GH25 family lysozyme M1 (1,4-beta-N-acetylmuramidase)
MHGETLPPQQNEAAPWIDEVQQSVAVPSALNTNKNCFVHQAGAYQKDGIYTATPFFAPSLAKYCNNNSCYFASWGTQAHVPNTFTSPIMVSVLI